jgi:hypothetical protein
VVTIVQKNSNDANEFRRKVRVLCEAQASKRRRAVLSDQDKAGLYWLPTVASYDTLERPEHQELHAKHICLTGGLAAPDRGLRKPRPGQTELNVRRECGARLLRDDTEAG